MNVSIIEKAIEFAKKTFAQDFSGHDYYHTERVYKLATKIATKETPISLFCKAFTDFELSKLKKNIQHIANLLITFKNT